MHQVCLSRPVLLANVTFDTSVPPKGRRRAWVPVPCPLDRWAILVCYLTIPIVLVAVFFDSYGAFLAGVLLSLLLV